MPAPKSLAEAKERSVNNSHTSIQLCLLYADNVIEKLVKDNILPVEVADNPEFIRALQDVVRYAMAETVYMTTENSVLLRIAPTSEFNKN